VSRHAPRGRRRDQPAPPPSRAFLVIAVAAAGFVIAGYLTITKFMGGSAVFCDAGGGCDAVQSSRYATMLGVPTALWGALAYAAVGGLAVTGLTAARWQVAFAIAAGAVGFSAYLTWISASVIHAFCGYCLASGAVDGDGDIADVGARAVRLARAPRARRHVASRECIGREHRERKNVGRADDAHVLPVQLGELLVIGQDHGHGRGLRSARRAQRALHAAGELCARNADGDARARREIHAGALEIDRPLPVDAHSAGGIIASSA